MNLTLPLKWPLSAMGLLLYITLSAQPCQTTTFAINADPAPVGAEPGAEEMNLNLFPLLGNQFAFPQSGQLGPASTSNFTYRREINGSCGASGADSVFPVAIIKFIPTNSASLQFLQGSPGQEGSYSFSLFRDNFDPAIDNCANFMESSVRASANGNVYRQFMLSDVVAGRTYFLVILPGSNASIPYPRNYSIRVSARNNTTLPTFFDGSQTFDPGYPITYFAYNLDDPSISRVAADGDFRELPAALYQIYGLNYDPARLLPDTIVGMTLAELNAPRNGTEPCLQVSNNELTIPVQEAAAAPVDWLTFAALRNYSTVELYWEVASETENDYFRIERSTDGSAWTDIGEVSGNGTTKSYAAFNFTDVRPSNDIIYYRLAQIDFDGTVNYSKTVVVAATDTETDAVSLVGYPNPFSDALSVTGDTHTAGEMPRIFDVQGRELTVQATISSDRRTATIVTSDLPTGVYLLRWGSQLTRVVKQ